MFFLIPRNIPCENFFKERREYFNNSVWTFCGWPPPPKEVVKIGSMGLLEDIVEHGIPHSDQRFQSIHPWKKVVIGTSRRMLLGRPFFRKMSPRIFFLGRRHRDITCLSVFVHILRAYIYCIT